MQRSVLFVCMGNICRSPAGEGVMRKRVAERGLADKVHVDSAGTIGYHAGSAPDARMQRAAAQRGYRLDSSARQFSPADLERFDLIIAMDRDNAADILALAEQSRHGGKVRLLSDFLAPGSPPDVPDPYYGGPTGFDQVLDMIEGACEPILEHLIRDDRPR